MASFADILAKKPKVKTRQALMVIGLQNDFFTPTGYLPVHTTPGFLDNIHSLVSKFRELDGPIIWVQTLYEADRLANTSSTGEGDALVITGLVDSEEIGSQGDDDESIKDLRLPTPQAQSRSAKHKQRALDLFKRVSSRRKALPLEEVKATVEEDEELFLLKRAKKGAACMPDTDGAAFTKEIGELINASHDAVITTTNYSAFLGTNLLLTLRARLVTEIHICGCLSNVSVLATVIDGARHGIKINVIQDALGFRKEARHEFALKRMDEVFDAWLVSSADILAKEHLTVVEAVKEEANPDAKGAKQAKEELEAMVGKLSLVEETGTAARTSGVLQTAATSSQSKSNARLNARLQDYIAAEDEDGDNVEKLLAARAQDRQMRRAEQRLVDSSEPVLVQSKTRMRKKKKKKPTEGSLVEPSVPKTKAVLHGSAIPAVVTPNEDDSHNSTALDAEPQTRCAEDQTDTVAGPVEAGTASTGVPAKKSATESSEPESELPPTVPADASSPAISSQPTPPKVGVPSPIPSGTTTMAKSSKLKSLANLPVLGPGDRIAEGDSRIVFDLIPPEYCHPSNPSEPLVATIFQELYSEVRWQKMLHQQGEVPRLVCCQGEFGEDGSKPVYRHPADQTLPLLHFSPKVQWIRRAAEKLAGHPLNHVLIQLYRSGNDYISEHSDKTLDIAKGSSIVNVSFGAQRTMRLRRKKDSKLKTTEDTKHETQRVALPHNSVFLFGLDSNAKWLHGIMADKRIEAERSERETAYAGARISLTFRYIATFLDSKESVIWGQGATSKDQRGAADVVNNDETEAARMIRGFSRENHSSDFEWVEWYGDGFDVLHMHEPPEQLPILFASSDAIETRQVQLALWESKVNYSLHEAPDLDKKCGASQRAHFRDNDTNLTEVSGLVSILHYIDRYYPLSSDKPVTAAAYSLIELLIQSPDFSSICTANRASSESPAEVPTFAPVLHILGERLQDSGGPFIAGKRFSIADCVVWPVLDECMKTWVERDESMWPVLVEYHRLAWKKKACLKKLRSTMG